MSDSSDKAFPGNTREQQAAAWVLRSDRGLTPAEQDEFSAWLAADSRHGPELARHRRHWQRLDTLAEWRPEHTAFPNPDLLAPPLRTRLRRGAPVALALAAAAAVVFGVALTRLDNTHDRLPAVAATSGGSRVLADGTQVELNRETDLSVHFTPQERRVRLERGEAHFLVTKDPSRPFIVNAGGVDVRAVGTAFNVRVDPLTVEVLVTEGRVQLDSAAPAADVAVPNAPAAPLVPVLEARQRAVVPIGAQSQPPPPQIATLTPREIERVLAWQHRLLEFNSTPLKEIVAEFNRRNVTQLFVVDPELASIRISATIRSDNIDGFVRLIEAGFGARAEKRGDSEILLRKVK